jgi:hypothetical protein
MSLRLRNSWRIGQAISEVASVAVPDLVEQRLEQVMIALIDDGDAHPRALESCAAASPPKPPPTITT